MARTGAAGTDRRGWEGMTKVGCGAAGVEWLGRKGAAWNATAGADRPGAGVLERSEFEGQGR